MTLSAFLFGLLAAFPLHSTAASGDPADSLDHRSVHSITLYSDNQWASNALTKWAAAGLAFGGDITSPLQTLVSNTAERRSAMGGGTSRQGVALTLPSMNLGEAPVKGRWKTTVALEHQQWATAQWTAGMARFFFGAHGAHPGEVGWMGPSSFKRGAATALKVGGIRTHRTSMRSTPVDMTLSWSANAGEVHVWQSGNLAYSSNFRWDGDSLELDLAGSSLLPIGVGTLFSVDLGMSIEEAESAGGRRDRWSFSARDWGSAVFRSGVYQRLDTAYADEGLPLTDGGGLDFSSVVRNDTLAGALRRKVPSTVRFRWDREAMRFPGVVWSVILENNSAAPRPQAELVRSSGRGAIRTTVGIGYGGWGGTYIPLNLEFPTRRVRQGRPGGTLAVSTRWLAAPGSGGRMALGLNWHETF